MIKGINWDSPIKYQSTATLWSYSEVLFTVLTDFKLSFGPVVSVCCYLLLTLLAVLFNMVTHLHLFFHHIEEQCCYSCHYIIQHSHNTVCDTKQEVGTDPASSFSYPMSNSFFSDLWVSNMALKVGLYHPCLLVLHALDSTSIVFLHFLLHKDLFKTVLVWAGWFFLRVKEGKSHFKKALMYVLTRLERDMT